MLIHRCPGTGWVPVFSAVFASTYLEWVRKQREGTYTWNCCALVWLVYSILTAAHSNSTVPPANWEKVMPTWNIGLPDLFGGWHLSRVCVLSELHPQQHSGNGNGQHPAVGTEVMCCSPFSCLTWLVWQSCHFS